MSWIQSLPEIWWWVGATNFRCRIRDGLRHRRSRIMPGLHLDWALTGAMTGGTHPWCYMVSHLSRSSPWFSFM